MVTALISTSPRQISKSSTEDSAPPSLVVRIEKLNGNKRHCLVTCGCHISKWAVSSVAPSNRPNLSPESNRRSA
ncbi:hypothetical protein RDWZM_009393, partial [Blomia tropicalis]